MRLAKHLASIAVLGWALAVAPCARAETVAEVHAALDGLGKADLAGPSPRLLAMLDRWFPKYTEEGPCSSGAGLISSPVVCEWTAAGAQAGAEAMPDMFVSLSERSLESVVFWGQVPLDADNWECADVASRPVSTVCVPRVVSKDRRARLISEWGALLATIAPQG